MFAVFEHRLIQHLIDCTQFFLYNNGYINYGGGTGGVDWVFSPHISKWGNQCKMLTTLLTLLIGDKMVKS